MHNNFRECSVGSEGFEQGEMLFGAREDMRRGNLFACRLQLESFQVLLVKSSWIYRHNIYKLSLQQLHLLLILLGSVELSLQELHLLLCLFRSVKLVLQELILFFNSLILLRSFKLNF